MAALDKETGATLWAGDPLADPRSEPVGNASPILFEQDGRRFLVSLSRRAVVGVDADTGRLLWTYAKPSQYRDNCATPLLTPHGIYHSNPSGSGGVLLRMHTRPGPVRVERVWECGMDNISGCSVLVEGFIYGSGQRNTGWACVDVRTGEQKYDAREIARGSVIYADNRLYCLSERGEMALVEPGPRAFEIVGRFRLTDGYSGDAWAHPVICDGRLYLRYHERLYCYEIGAE
jgi:outer membrane protein assembly factor BamB